MLGEDHSLLNEFPNYRDKISELNQANPSFAENAAKYHALDAEIRKLELRNAPIEDSSFHQLKHDRAMLKDMLYQQIIG
ncbi:MAG: hypothetical protein CL811_05845 [Colwelliaceae bacterium]|nr:hypothetical protein [Colwelliaceae bacterium]|tara:strand:+ start:312 stop:548 length:237 start_codon:yes stop_codon:yes gene_type:complete